MEKLDTTPFQQALDLIESLPSNDQEVLLEIVRRRLVEKRRVEIAENALLTLQAVQEGHARYGSLDDLRRDLAGQP